ncbi:MAG: hypothetical protein AAF708_23510, partial [Deinococcota bacterium]
MDTSDALSGVSVDVNAGDVNASDVNTVDVNAVDVSHDVSNAGITKTLANPTSPKPSSSKVLPICTDDVLAGLASEHIITLEQTHGNGDLIRVLTALGIAGPLRVLDPWQLEDMSTGTHLIHAGGYAALPFGESYPPLIEFIHTVLDSQRGQTLPQQAVSGWRAALETNLVSLLAREA